MFEKKTRVLLVDDLANLREVLKDRLEFGLGFERVLEAANGREALEILKKQSEIGEPIDLIFSDFFMPVMNGHEFLTEIRKLEQFKYVPFIVITGDGEQREIAQMIREGAHNYLVKPFSTDDLKDKLSVTWTKYEKSLKATQQSKPPHEKQILVVDDDKDLGHAMQGFLEDAGYAVHYVENGKIAQEVLKENQFDLVITDVDMPKMGGIELLDWIRDQIQGLRIVLVSGTTKLHETQKQLKNKPEQYLAKPFLMTDLLNTVKSLTA